MFQQSPNSVAKTALSRLLLSAAVFNHSVADIWFDMYIYMFGIYIHMCINMYIYVCIHTFTYYYHDIHIYIYVCICTSVVRHHLGIAKQFLQQRLSENRYNDQAKIRTTRKH